MPGLLTPIEVGEEFYQLLAGKFRALSLVGVRLVEGYKEGC